MKNRSLLELIYKKRAGKELSQEEIESFVQSLSSRNAPPDYQVASLLAFIFMKGMNFEETTALTQAMRFSGTQFSFAGFPKGAHFVDKHSTGGVGDKITLCLAPLVAALDERLYFPTISGRGLGHTGGTVDKLQSIPGFSLDLSLSKFYRLLKKHHLCFLMQTKDITPADRKLYSLRDATGTVESIPLITASILSKKLSETLNHLVIDLKCGNGAFITDLEKSEVLGDFLQKVCQQSSIRADIFMTRMDSPLGDYSGNALEVDEACAILRGEGPETSSQLTEIFAMKFLEGLRVPTSEGLERIRRAIETGAALKKWEKIVEAQGGSLKKLARRTKTRAKNIKKKIIKADRPGWLFYETRQLGFALVALGAGRLTREDKIDPDVGLYHPFSAGSRIEKGDEVLTIYYRDKKQLAACEARIKEAVEIRETSFPKLPLVLKLKAHERPKS